jgi:hypothetical protein
MGRKGTGEDAKLRTEDRTKNGTYGGTRAGEEGKEDELDGGSRIDASYLNNTVLFAVVQRHLSIKSAPSDPCSDPDTSRSIHPSSTTAHGACHSQRSFRVRRQ